MKVDILESAVQQIQTAGKWLDAGYPLMALRGVYIAKDTVNAYINGCVCDDCLMEESK